TAYAAPYDHSVGSGLVNQALTYTITNDPTSPEMLSVTAVTIPGGVAGEFFSSVAVTGVSGNVTVTSITQATAGSSGLMNLLFFNGGLTSTAGVNTATVNLSATAPAAETLTAW